MSYAPRKKKKKEKAIAIPTGRDKDGSYFTESDIANTDGSTSISRLPPNSKEPLMLDPKHKNNNTYGEFNGNLVPFVWSEVDGIRTYRCKCPVVFDKETGIRF